MLTKLIGSEEHKPLLIALLNALLELPPDRQIEEVTHLREEQRPRVEALKRSIVDVKCRDVRGAVCVVETQVLNVEGFEKRVVYNASKVREGTVRREGVRCVEAPDGQTSSSSRLRPGRRHGFEKSQFASICSRRIWCQGRVSSAKSMPNRA